MSSLLKEPRELWAPCDLAWIQNSLPALWAGLVEGWGAKAGVVVLKAINEDSLYENASFGYEEDGFFYEFLSRNSADWDRVFSSESPVYFSGSSHSLFLESGFATVQRLGTLASPLGFLLLEWEISPSDTQTFPFFLLSKWIESGLNQSQKIPIISISESYYSFFPGVLQALESMSGKPFFCISGEPGSGKKTFAKFFHDRFKRGSAFLLVETIPDHLGKLEKSLSEWATQAKGGTLVFAGIQSWTEGQQATFYSFLTETQSLPQILFLENSDLNSRYFQPFAKLALSEKLPFPSLTSLVKPVQERLLTLVFAGLVAEQKRGNLELSLEAKKFLLNQGEISSIGDLKNRLVSGILHCKGTSVMVEDFHSLSEEISLPEWEDLHLRRGTKALERQKILLAMRIFSGNQLRMAKALGISRGSLQYKLKQLGIQTQ